LKLGKFFSTTIDGGTGLVKVPYASTLGRGKILVNSQMANTVNKGQFWYYEAVTQIGVLFGMTEKLDIWANWRLYQDNVISSDGEGTGNIKIAAKYNFYNHRRNKYNLSGEGILLFPTASFYNLEWEPYTSGETEIQLSIIGTVAKKYHTNFGYIFHNDSDVGLDGDTGQPYALKGQPVSHEIVFGGGGEYSLVRDLVIITGELSGRKVLNSKSNLKASEFWLNFIPGVKYFLNDNLFFAGGVDILLLGSKNNNKVFRPADRNGGTTVDQNYFWKDNSNYPFWRINLAMNWLAFQKYPAPVRGRPDIRDEEGFLDIIEELDEVGVSSELQDKMRIYKKVKIQQRATKEAEEELTEIKMKRKEAENELKKLREMLENLE